MPALSLPIDNCDGLQPVLACACANHALPRRGFRTIPGSGPSRPLGEARHAELTRRQVLFAVSRLFHKLALPHLPSPSLALPCPARHKDTRRSPGHMAGKGCKISFPRGPSHSVWRVRPRARRSGVRWDVLISKSNGDSTIRTKCRIFSLTTCKPPPASSIWHPLKWRRRSCPATI